MNFHKIGKVAPGILSPAAGLRGNQRLSYNNSTYIHSKFSKPHPKKKLLSQEKGPLSMKHIFEADVDNPGVSEGINFMHVNQNSGFLQNEKVYDVHNLKALNSSFHTQHSEFPISTALYSPKNID